MEGARQSGKQHSGHMEYWYSPCEALKLKNINAFFPHTLKSITTEHSNQNERRGWEVGGGQMMKAYIWCPRKHLV